MADLEFELALPRGSAHPILLVGGGLDVDGDGTIDGDDELLAFKKGNGFTWSVTRHLDELPPGLLFVIQFTVGVGVPWRLVVREGTRELYHLEQTTFTAHELVQGRLP